MEKLQRLVICLALMLPGCAVKAPTAPPDSDQEHTITLSAGQSVTLTNGQRAEAPSGVTVIRSGGGTIKINGHRNTVNDHAGVIVSVPTNATGPADNLIVAENVQSSGPVAPSTIASTTELNELNHWQSFLKLASRPDAVVTVKDLESTFGQKAVHKTGPGYNFYSIPDVAQLIPHADPVALARHPEEVFTSLSFDFPRPRYDDFNRYIAMCIKTTQVISDLQNAGWVLRIHRPAIRGDVREVMPPDQPSGSYHFIKGYQGVIVLIYSEPTACVGAVIMEANKAEFDRIEQTDTTSRGR